jgi:hypothetical protein
MTGCGASRTMYRIGFEWRQENPSGSFLRLRARVGRYGEINQRAGRIVNSHRPTEANRSKHASLRLHERPGCRSLTCLQRDRRAVGVQVPTYVVQTKNSHAERGNAVPSPGATPGRPTVRQAEGGAERRGRDVCRQLHPSSGTLLNAP